MMSATIEVEDAMVLFPNRETTHPDDVRGRDEREYREDGGTAQPRDLVEQASRDSFPASDVPPWTLGYIGPPAPAGEVRGRLRTPISNPRDPGD